MEVEALAFPVLALHQDSTVSSIGEAELLTLCRYPRIRDRFFDGLRLCDSEGTVARVTAWAVEEGAIRPWHRWFHWVSNVPLAITISLEKEPTPGIESIRTELIQALYDQRDFFETTYLLDDWLKKVSQAEDSAQLVSLFVDFPLEK